MDNATVMLLLANLIFAAFSLARVVFRPGRYTIPVARALRVAVALAVAWTTMALAILVWAAIGG